MEKKQRFLTIGKINLVCMAFDTPYASFLRDANSQIPNVALSN